MTVRSRLFAVAAAGAPLAACGRSEMPGLQTPALLVAENTARSDFARLAVSDAGLDRVVVFNRHYKAIFKIPDSNPDGIWIDGSDNIYVANPSPVNVVNEYDATGKLIFAYRERMTDPVDVTTDVYGHIYVVNSGAPATAMVVEFAQQHDAPFGYCLTGLDNQGIAVDSGGDLFVSGNDTEGKGHLLEYPNTLAYCSSTVSPRVKFGTAGGIKIDSKGNLVVCDRANGVDIVPPPYASVRKTIRVKGAREYDYDALDRLGENLFVTDPPAGKAYVVAYSSGKLKRVLGSAQGLKLPQAPALY